jgi:hypothetical protein
MRSDLITPFPTAGFGVPTVSRFSTWKALLQQLTMPFPTGGFDDWNQHAFFTEAALSDTMPFPHGRLRRTSPYALNSGDFFCWPAAISTERRLLFFSMLRKDVNEQGDGRD